MGWVWGEVVGADLDWGRTPQAYPQMSSQALGLLSTQYANLIADHFVPSLPPLPILPPTK